MTTAHTRENGAEHDGESPLSILVSGAGGMIGDATVRGFSRRGYRVARIVRRTAESVREVSWEPEKGNIQPDDLEEYDAVVHLAGAGIAQRRWTHARKELILNSRVRGTKLLCETLAKLSHPPRVMVCASAIGFYGSRGDETLDETATPGDGFLADVCRQWEAAARPALDAGIRIVFARFGIVLSPSGGALKKMLLPFRLGLGGKIADGRQYWSWVSLEDAVGAINHAIEVESLSGAVNVVAPEPATNAEFSRTLARVLRRPALLPMPAVAAQLMLGEMAEELLLSSAKVAPRQLVESGYQFAHPTLETCLRSLLGRD